MHKPRTVPATPSNEPGWSFQTLLDVFAASLPIWMRRFGVRSADVEDATQDAFIAAWQGLSALPTSPEEARHEMLRLAANVAQRWRRDAARLVCVDEWEARDPRNVEEWIAARMLWLEALSRLDERSRKLLTAYQIDGRTYAEIGTEMREKEDTIRKRVNVANKKLRAELDKLLGKDKDENSSSVAMGLGLALDPFDRAVFRAILDVEDEFGLGPPPASTVRPKVTTKPWCWQYFSMGILALALFLVPGQGRRTEILHAAKMGNIPLPSIDVRAAMQMPHEARSDTRESLPQKMASSTRQVVPTLTKRHASIVKQLLEDGSSMSP